MPIMIFDLDGTLHNLGVLHEDVVPILRWCKSHQLPAHIASFNPVARIVCKLLGIEEFFISIKEGGGGRSKLDMINEIMHSYPNHDLQNVMFFDDDPQNIRLVVKDSPVCAVWCPTGITWESISLAWQT